MSSCAGITCWHHLLTMCHCCLLVVCQHHHASLSPPCHIYWPCCCRLVLLFLCCVIVVSLLLSHPMPQQGGLERWDRGYLPRINNDEQQMSSVILVATLQTAMWHLHSLLAVGGHFHQWVVIFFCRGRFRLWAVACIHRKLFSFVGGCLNLWVVI